MVGLLPHQQLLEVLLVSQSAKSRSLTCTADIQVMSWDDWELQRAFSTGHTKDVTALGWSPNGALLTTAGADGHVLLWDTATQKVITK